MNTTQSPSITDEMSDLDLPEMDELKHLPMGRVMPDPNQPRQEFKESSLQELASSIRARGVVQPITVRPHPQLPDHFFIIDGERRWRASSIAEKSEIPCIIRQIQDHDKILMDQLTANYHNEEMRPIEEAMALQRMLDRERDKGNPEPREAVMREMGLSPSQLSKKLAILKYPEDVLNLLKGKVIREYQTVKNLSMLKPEDRALVIEEVAAPQGRFVGKEFNANPQKYVRRLKAERGNLEGAGSADVPRETGEKTVKPNVMVRWHLTSEELQRLVEATEFRAVLAGVDMATLDESAQKGIFEQFRKWLNDVGTGEGVPA